MRVRAQSGEVPLLTVVETDCQSRGKRRRRWVTIDQRGKQSPTTHQQLGVALRHAAYQMLAWRLWTAEDNAFCR